MKIDENWWKLMKIDEKWKMKTWKMKNEKWKNEKFWILPGSRGAQGERDMHAMHFDTFAFVKISDVRTYI